MKKVSTFLHVISTAILLVNMSTVCTNSNQSQRYKELYEKLSEESTLSYNEWNEFFQIISKIASIQEIQKIIKLIPTNKRASELPDIWIYAAENNRPEIIQKTYDMIPNKDHDIALACAMQKYVRFESYDHLQHRKPAALAMIKTIMQIDPEVDKGLAVKYAVGSPTLSKIFLPYATDKYQKLRALLHALDKKDKELINVALDYTDVEKIIKDDECKTIQEAIDLTTEQKEILSDAYQKIDLKKLLISEQITLPKDHGARSLSDDIVSTYLPVLAYQNMVENHDGHKTLTAKIIQRLAKEYPDQLDQFISNILTDYADRCEHKKFVAKWRDCGFLADLMRSGILSKIKNIEEQYQNSEYQILFHARAWYWNFSNDIWNMTQALQNNQNKMSDRISLRQRNKECDVAPLLVCREKLLKYGSQRYLTTTTKAKDCDSEITAFNQSIVSNSDMSGIWSPKGSEMTASYFLHQGRDRLGENEKLNLIKQMFESAGLKDCIDDQELAKLYELHQAAYIKPCGELLCLIIAKNQIDQMLYPATDGFRKSYEQSFPSELMQQTEKLIASDPTFSGTTNNYYGLAVSDIPGEYDSKYTLKSLHVADDQKYQEYIDQRNALFEKLKERMKRSTA